MRYGVVALSLCGLSGVRLRACVGVLGAMSGGGGRGARERGGERNERRGGRAGRAGAEKFVVRGGGEPQGASGAGDRFRMPGNVGQEGSQVVLATLSGSSALREWRKAQETDNPK